MKNLQGRPCQSVEEAYQANPFFCPVIWAKDGFNISLQINRSNYCTSSEGSRRFSFHWKEVEFGYPEGTNSESAYLLNQFPGEPEWGSIDIETAERILQIHGGIDWDKTIAEAEKYIYSAD